MTKPKKIILFASSNIAFDQRLQKVSTSLQNNDFDVLFVGRKQNDKSIKSNFSFSYIMWRCFFNTGVLFYLELNVRIFFFILKNKAAIYTANDLDTVLGVALAKPFRKQSKFVFDAHEYFTEVPELKNKKRKRAIWQKIESRFVPNFDAFYTVNYSLANIFKQNLTLDFKVVRNVPVLTKSKKVYIKENEKYILYQGALNKGRGLEQIIRLMPKVDMKLKLAGSGDLLQDLKDLVRNLNLEDKVQFLGQLEPNALRIVTQKAYIGINLLENTSKNYYYSLANKFFDYMHQNVPQICMNFPEYKAINRESEVAVLVKNLDQVTLLHAVKKLADKSFYKKIQQNAKQAKVQYTWAREEAVLLSVYQSL